MTLESSNDADAARDADDDLLTSVVSSSQELSEFSFLTPLDQIDQNFQNIFSSQTTNSQSTENQR